MVIEGRGAFCRCAPMPSFPDFSASLGSNGPSATRHPSRDREIDAPTLCSRRELRL
jgi:hypothetical protein